MENLKNMLYSELHKITESKLANADDYQMDKLFDLIGSKNKTTRIFKDPSIATHSELLVFAKMLDMEATLLFNEYGLGMNGLHPLEKELYPAAASAAA